MRLLIETDAMNVELLLAGTLCFAAGVVLAGLFARAKAVVAANRIRAESAVELATSRENVRLQTAERERLQGRVVELQTDVERWRTSLDEVSTQRAVLDERASRVGPLVTKVGELEQSLAETGIQVASLREATAKALAELHAERDAHSLTESRHHAETQARQISEAALVQATTELAQLTTQQTADREQFTDKLAFIDEAKRTLSDQFKNLANDILEEKGKRFAEQNQTNLGSLLDPLKQKLTEFQSKVEDVYVKEGKDRTALAEQVKQLMGLNQTLSEDAKNLTSALKGSNKTQGNWGELVLERVLESSGLRKGHEYRLQESHAQEDGRRLQPDVVISLPEDRSLVVDSKVSLTAYEECASADNVSDREAALNRHLASIRSHIKGLSGKNYQAMYQLRSLDFVLMFIPIERAPSTTTARRAPGAK